MFECAQKTNYLGRIYGLVIYNIGPPPLTHKYKVRAQHIQAVVNILSKIRSCYTGHQLTRNMEIEIFKYKYLFCIYLCSFNLYSVVNSKNFGALYSTENANTGRM